MGKSSPSTRSELTASQRTHYTKRRREIWLALHPEPRQRFYNVWDALEIEPEPKAQRVADLPTDEQVEKLFPPVAKHGRAQALSFAAETALITGESKQGINHRLAIADKLGDDLLRTSGTSLDSGKYPTAGRLCIWCSPAPTVAAPAEQPTAARYSQARG